MAMTQTLTDPRTIEVSSTDLDECARCGHSKRNHEVGGRECARSLCDCARFVL
ncbi:MAG TPA: hypothetical protein VKT18_03655 [Acidimicrobiales bacterium]|nr:hypothetical protein [Acidimicrobiales bacterium]